MPSTTSNNDVEKNAVSRAEYSDPVKNGASRAEYSDPVSYERYPTKIANPGPAGLFSFAATTFMLSMYNVNTRGVTHPNVVVGMAIFGGGLTQFIAGMWEFPRGNVFGATAFASYGAFWMSFATINIPASGIAAAYATPEEMANALGIFLVAWMMITIFFLMAVIRRSVSFSILLFMLTIAFALLSAAEFTGSGAVQKAGGVFGIITALVAFYIGAGELLAAESTPVMRFPLGNFDRRHG